MGHAHNIGFAQYGRQNMPSTVVILLGHRIPALSFQIQVRIIVHGRPGDINTETHTAQSREPLAAIFFFLR